MFRNVCFGRFIALFRELCGSFYSWYNLQEQREIIQHYRNMRTKRKYARIIEKRK